MMAVCFLVVLPCLLWLAGDIELNPGPVKWPCVLCAKPVRSNQDGVECSNCAKWCHRKCEEMSLAEYHRLSNSNDDWFCRQCTLPNFSDSFFSSDSMDESVENDSSFVLPLAADALLVQPCGLRIIYHNVQGLLSKAMEIQQWLEDCVVSPNIFCFSETWVNTALPSLQVPGYEVFYSPPLPRNPIDAHHRYLPGSCMFIPTILSPEHPPLCDDIERSCMALNVSCCFVTCKNLKLAVVSFYRSPSTKYGVVLDDFCQVLSRLLLSVRHVILAGDVNIDLFADSAAKAAYNDLLIDFRLRQLILEPSRVTDTSSTLIDHIICTVDLPVLDIQQAVGLSDHRVQIVDFDIVIQRSPAEFRWIRPFRHCCWGTIRSSLSTALWSTMNVFDDVNDMWGFFYGIILSCLNAHVPMKTVYCKYSKRPTPWITPEILAAICEKNKAKRIAEHSGDAGNITRYKRLKNRLKSDVRAAKLTYLSSLLQQSRKSPHLSARLWSEVNEVIGRRKSRESVIDMNLSLDSINDFFCNIAVSRHHQPASSWTSPANCEHTCAFRFHSFTCSDVLAQLQNVDVNKAAGSDGVSARFLKEVAKEIVEPLTALYNKSIQSGEVSLDWKVSCDSST